ncbi:MAG: GIY-YIG nuclease family protein [Defluviitaleaceae bacterium]|nr:GIY-YIG nuclease family protein [Defluviitaleaceae bacterium]
MDNNAYIYFMSNRRNNVLYIGVTSNLEKRVWEHKNKVYPECFTAKYNCTKLVYFEQANDIQTAVSREKQLKNWKREWKDKLIDETNPTRTDLSLHWYD